MTIISFAYRFVFCKTLKTAGTSIEVSLAAMLPDSDVVTPVVPEEQGHCPRNFRFGGKRLRNHVPMAKIRAICGNAISGFSSFCIERHPVEKCLSHFAMLRYSPHHARRRSTDPMTWSDYVSAGVFPMDLQRYASLRGADGWQPDVDAVFEYNDLEESVHDFLVKRGLAGFRMVSRAKSGFRSGPEVPSPGEVEDGHRKVIMDAFKDSNDFLASNFGIHYK